MKTTNKIPMDGIKLAGDTNELASKLGCGICTAIKIGTEAGAKIKVGRRVLWNFSKVQSYLDSISEG